MCLALSVRASPRDPSDDGRRQATHISKVIRGGPERHRLLRVSGAHDFSRISDLLENCIGISLTKRHRFAVRCELYRKNFISRAEEGIITLILLVRSRFL